MEERTFYCCWCSRRKPVSTGYVEMSRKRKKCSECRDKLQKPTQGNTDERTHARPQ